jgi:hypothetical protein
VANSPLHAGLPYPVRGARYTLAMLYLDASGTPADPVTPDTEISKDGGTFVDCIEEVTTIGTGTGSGYLTLNGAETDAALVVLAGKVASGPKPTLATLTPRVLPVLESGTATAGAAGSLTLAAGAAAYSLVGCILRTTGAPGGGGTGGLDNQARVITAYNPSTKVATVAPNWEVNPAAGTTYEVLLTDCGAGGLWAGGSVLALKQLNIVNSSGDALVATGGGTGCGINATGGSGGGGAGLRAFGGGSGSGIQAMGGGAGGFGISATAGAAGNPAVQLQGSGNGPGMSILGGASGSGLVVAAGAGGNGDGVSATGNGAGSGLVATGGVTGGDGARYVAGGTNGDGFEMVGGGGTGLPLNPPAAGGGGLDAAATAAAVWNAARATYNAPLSFGESVKLNAAGLATDAVTEIQGGLATPDDIANAVWDEVITTGHVVPGSAAVQLNAAGAAGDPWTVALPGPYTGLQAGKIVGDNLNATVSSRAVPGAAMTLAANAVTGAALDPTASAEIAGAVWDELKAGHVVPNSFGDYLDIEVSSRASTAGGGGLDAAQTAAAVWNAARTTYNAGGSFGEGVRLAAGAVNPAAIATDAIDGDAIAPSAVTEIQAGLATAGAAMALTPAERDAIADANFARALPASPSVGTAGEALIAARAQAFGRWVIAGNTLTLYAPNGTTVLKTFALAPAGGPYLSRT